jgi:hypothetical protein
MKPRKRLPTALTDSLPRTVRDDVFLWHNHIRHTDGMTQGMNGFRYRFAHKPVNYRMFMRCKCGWSGLPHYSVRGFGAQKCYPTEKFWAEHRRLIARRQKAFSRAA